MKSLLVKSLCKIHGIKLTKQRRLIIEALRARRDHPTADDLYQEIVKKNPRIGLATIYRTLNLLQECHIVLRHEFLSIQDDKRGARCACYEIAQETHHDHLINVETGEIIEFKNEAIEFLQKQIAKKLGFEIVGHRLELFCKSTKES